MSHRHIAFFVGGGASNDSYIKGKGLEIEILFPFEFDEFHHLILGDSGHLSALQTGVDKCAQTDFGDYTYFFAGHLPPQMGHDALGQGMGLNLIIAHQLYQAGSLANMAGDDFSDEALMAEMVHPFDISEGVVSGSAAVGEGEIAGSSCFQKAFFNGRRHLFAKTTHARRGPCHRCSVFDQLRRLLGANNFGSHLFSLLI